MNQLTLPPWVKPEAIAHHSPSCILFPIYHCQQHRSTGQILLFDAPKGIQGAKYPLIECEPFTPDHLKGIALVTIGGKPVTIIHEYNRLTFTNGQQQVHVQLSKAAELRAIAHNFASFFDGEVIEEVSQ